MSSKVLYAAMLASLGIVGLAYESSPSFGATVEQAVASGSATAVNELFVPGAKTEAAEHSVPGLVVVVREWPIAPNVRKIVANARVRKKIDVVFPNHPPIAFVMTGFEARAGFNEKGEPDTNLADAEISYAWQGSSNGRQMTIDVFQGRMSAKIQAGGARLYLVAFEASQPVLREIDLRPNGPNDALAEGSS